MTDLLQTIGSWLVSWGQMVGDGVNAVMAWLANPTGNIWLDIPIYLAVYGIGWYACSMSVSIAEIHNRESKTKYRCSRQKGLDKDMCRANHRFPGEEPCWRNMPVQLEPYQKEQMVKENMGICCLWPIAAIALIFLMGCLVLLAPLIPVAFVGALIYFAVLRPMVRVSISAGDAISTGMVNGSSKLASVSVNTIVKRADQLNAQKALEAKKE